MSNLASLNAPLQDVSLHEAIQIDDAANKSIMAGNATASLLVYPSANLIANRDGLGSGSIRIPGPIDMCMGD